MKLENATEVEHFVDGVGWEGRVFVRVVYIFVAYQWNSMHMFMGN